MEGHGALGRLIGGGSVDVDARGGLRAVYVMYGRSAMSTMLYGKTTVIIVKGNTGTSVSTSTGTSTRTIVNFDYQFEYWY